MIDLRPCSSCARHVRTDDRSCPFCGADGAPIAPRRSSIARTATRAAIFYFGATLAGCADDGGQNAMYGGAPVPQIVEPPNGPELPEDPGGASIAQPYGLPPVIPEEPPPPPEQAPLPEEPPPVVHHHRTSIAQPYGAPPDPTEDPGL